MVAGVSFPVSVNERNAYSVQPLQSGIMDSASAQSSKYVASDS